MSSVQEKQPLLPTLGASSRIPCVDALRFIAASLVLIDHGGYEFTSGDGVQFFLILSGFLFTWLFCLEWEKSGGIQVGRFFFRRFMRLMPAFWCAVLFTMVAKLALKLPVAWDHLQASLFFYANYYNAFHGHPATGFDIFWTLSLQEQFYLVWPWLFIFFMSRGPTFALRGILALIVIICVARTYAYYSGLVSESYLYNAFEFRCDTMLMGALAAIMIRYHRGPLAYACLERFVVAPFITLALLAGYRIFIVEEFRYGWGYTLHALLVAVLMLQLMSLEGKPIWSWLNSRLIRAGGLVSYSMYLYHLWGLAVGLKLKGLPLFLQVAVGGVVTMLLAIPSYYFIERKGMELRDKLLAARAR